MSVIFQPSPPYGPTFLGAAPEADAFEIIKMEPHNVICQKVIYEQNDLSISATFSLYVYNDWFNY